MTDSPSPRCATCGGLLPFCPCTTPADRWMSESPSALRAELNASRNLVRALRDERDEALRLLRVAMFVDRCEHRSGDEGQLPCDEPAVITTKSPHGPGEECWCAEHAPTWKARSRHPQVADVRRIAELLKGTSNG